MSDIVRLKEVIKQAGMTYEQLGDAVGLTKTSIARIASGTQTPSFQVLAQIADALSVDIGDLFYSSKDKEMQPIYIKNEEGELQKIGYLSKK